MPTYEYRCDDCGERFEVFQRITEEPLQICRACGGPLRKLFHPAGIVFKGSGFYTTDSRAAKKGGDPTGGERDGGGKPSEKKGSGGKPAGKDSESTGSAGKPTEKTA